MHEKVKSILIRVLRTYLFALLGMVGANAAGITPVPLETFGPALWVAAQASVAPAFVSLVVNILEMTGGYESLRG